MGFTICYSDNRPNNNMTIYLDENTNRYCYVNLTKQQVCRRRFNSIKDALMDLYNYSHIKSIIFGNHFYSIDNFINHYLECSTL